MLLVLQTLGKLLWPEKRNFAFFFCAIDKRHSVLYSNFNHFLFASVRETSSHSRFSSLNFAQFCLFLILHFVGSFFVSFPVLSLLHCTFLFIYFVVFVSVWVFGFIFLSFLNKFIFQFLFFFLNCSQSCSLFLLACCCSMSSLVVLVLCCLLLNSSTANESPHGGVVVFYNGQIYLQRERESDFLFLTEREK